MIEDERIYTVCDIISDYVKSPSLQHLRDPHSVMTVAKSIIRQLDRGSGIWKKWEGERDALLKASLACWIPVEELQEYLNTLPGARLTATDIAQRQRAYFEEPYAPLPNDELKEGCLLLFVEEKAQGTELPAIIGRIVEHVEVEEERIRLEREARYKMMRAAEKLAAEQRLLSGSDCKWTQLQKALESYCRVNGRTYRLTPTKDRRWRLHRVDTVSAVEKGILIGTYGGRGDATKVVAKIAFETEYR
ncbi:hypothetical protein [Rhizobium leguminosarum]|uniref:hypothetical protein n=1 Tax=Rhizobium leguminosarum TaxID=384 RepID=UPI001030EF6E|nr:hypothetical protein [Rhizobium leguminosarum]TAV81554.1 hypothetical protein ELI22_33920 [Rhizobium leguminosarum]TAV94160.1 hypothetical protein ELI21_10315 [Rhizobium leguminosarum]TAW35235.1 hypothetical protein ELI23_10355 [Rhizobium leguminosarum]